MTAIQLHIDRRPPAPVTWPGWKLCPPLEAWRTDAPESGPFCVVCGGRIEVGDRYALALPFFIACITCSRVRVPDPEPPRERRRAS